MAAVNFKINFPPDFTNSSWFDKAFPALKKKLDEIEAENAVRRAELHRVRIACLVAFCWLWVPWVAVRYTIRSIGIGWAALCEFADFLENGP